MNPGEPKIPPSLFVEEASLISDTGSERAVLAIIMMQPTLIIEAERILHPMAFSHDINNFIFKFMLWLYKQATQHGRPYSFDAMTMLTWAKWLGPHYEQHFLQQTAALEHVHGIEMMAQAQVVKVDQFAQYVWNLNDRGRRRQMYVTARELQKSVLNFQNFPEASALAISASSQFSEMGFDVKDDGESSLRKLTSIREDAMFKVEMNHTFKHERLFHVPCYPYRFWMKLLGGGFPRRGVTVICARPKVGKSSLMLSSGTEMAVGENQFDLDGNPLPRTQTPVLYLDTEMSRQETFFRQLSHVSKMLETDILAGKFLEDGVAEAAINAELDRMGDAPFYYVNIAGKDMEFVTSIMRQFRNEIVGRTVKVHPRTGKEYVFSNPGIVYYDWLKLPDSSGLKLAQETQLIGFQAQKLKNAAFELDLPVIAGAQLNREAIRATPSDWQWNAESFISASDRLAMFCNVMCVLRNVMPEEQEQLLLTKPEWMIERKDSAGLPLEGDAGMRFNQRLHQILGRGCGVFTTGIPMYIDRGRAKYYEVSDPETLQYIKQKISPRPSLTDKKRGGVPKPQAVAAPVGQDDAQRATQGRA